MGTVEDRSLNYGHIMTAKLARAALSSLGSELIYEKEEKSGSNAGADDSFRRKRASWGRRNRAREVEKVRGVLERIPVTRNHRRPFVRRLNDRPNR